MYVDNLKSDGFTGVNSGRILTYAEVESGIAASYKISGENYWLGSALDGTYLGIFYSYGSIGCYGYTTSNTGGVRPIIYISISDIE